MSESLIARYELDMPGFVGIEEDVKLRRKLAAILAEALPKTTEKFRPCDLSCKQITAALKHTRTLIPSEREFIGRVATQHGMRRVTISEADEINRIFGNVKKNDKRT